MYAKQDLSLDLNKASILINIFFAVLRNEDLKYEPQQRRENQSDEEFRVFIWKKLRDCDKSKEKDLKLFKKLILDHSTNNEPSQIKAFNS